MWKPALAIFSMVASCKLPLGRPNRSFLFFIPRLPQVLPRARAGIGLRRFLHPRGGLDFPRAPRKGDSFLWWPHGMARGVWRDPGGRSFHPYPSAAFDENFALGQRADDSRIQTPLRLLYPLVQDRGGILRQDWHGFLREDRAAINPLVDQVDGAAGHFHAVIERLFPGLQTWKSREQGGMDVHHALGKNAQEIAFQDAHEAGQHHQVNFRRDEPVDEGPLRLLIQLGSELARRDELRGQSALARLGENSS